MKGQKLVLWILAGAGVILMYAAYHNVSPTSLLAKYMGLTSSLSPLTQGGSAAVSGDSKGGSTGGGSSGGGGGGGGGGAWGDDKNPTGGGLGGQYKVKPDRSITLSPYTGQWEEVDANGYSVGSVPAGYQVSPGTYLGDGVIGV